MNNARKIFCIIFNAFFHQLYNLDQLKKSISELTFSSAGGYLAYQLSDADIFSTLLGSSAGLILGSVVGDYLEKNDYYYYKLAVFKSLDLNEVGTTEYWSNKKSGNEGVIKVKNYFQSPECRLIEHTYIVKKKSKNFYDTACRKANGSWSIIR